MAAATTTTTTMTTTTTAAAAAATVTVTREYVHVYVLAKRRTAVDNERALCGAFSSHPACFLLLSFRLLCFESNFWWQSNTPREELLVCLFWCVAPVVNDVRERV
jgi:hypothetical protein